MHDTASDVVSISTFSDQEDDSNSGWWSGLNDYSRPRRSGKIPQLATGCNRSITAGKNLNPTSSALILHPSWTRKIVLRASDTENACRNSNNEFVSFRLRHRGHAVQEWQPEDESTPEQPLQKLEGDHSLPETPVRKPTRRRSIMHSGIDTSNLNTEQEASHGHLRSVVDEVATLEALLRTPTSRQSGSNSKISLGDFLTGEARHHSRSSLNGSSGLSVSTRQKRRSSLISSTSCVSGDMFLQRHVRRSTSADGNKENHKVGRMRASLEDCMVSCSSIATKQPQDQLISEEMMAFQAFMKSPARRRSLLGHQSSLLDLSHQSNPKKNLLSSPRNVSVKDCISPREVFQTPPMLGEYSQDELGPTSPVVNLPVGSTVEDPSRCSFKWSRIENKKETESSASVPSSKSKVSSDERRSSHASCGIVDVDFSAFRRERIEI